VERRFDDTEGFERDLRALTGEFSTNLNCMMRLYRPRDEILEGEGEVS
jgi:hypothetical protein